MNFYYHYYSKMKSKAVKQLTPIEHLKKRSMWAGSQELQSMQSYELVNDFFEQTTLKYPPALYKAIDEIVVNAIDHCTNHPGEVTEIHIELKDGVISVKNNGPGISTEMIKSTSGELVHSVQLIFTEMFAGTNLDDEETKERVVGGQNGVGSKITVVFSKEFTVETIDQDKKVKYVQTYRNNLDVIEPPKITKTTAKPYTKISFLLDFQMFKTTKEKFESTLYKLLQLRTYQAAAYTRIPTYFNDKKIHIKEFSKFCEMFCESSLYETTFTQPSGKFPWTVCFGITSGKEQHHSIINGIYVEQGGTHIKFIEKYIVDNLKDRIERELSKSKVTFNKNLLLNVLYIFVCGSVPNPDFDSQTKSCLSTPVDNFANYRMSDKAIEGLWKHVQEPVLANFLKKQMGSVKLRANRGRIDVPMYEEAENCRKAHLCHKCGLIVAEGASAMGTAKTGLRAKNMGDFTFDWYGVYGVRGVVINALKESIEVGKKRSQASTKKLGNRVPGGKVLENERITSLIRVLGLDFNKKYELTPTGDKEWATMRYGYIAGLVDQDLDGFNIFGLLCTFFMTYWPALIDRKFIRRIYTPVVRAFPKDRKKDKVKNFYTEEEQQKWAETVGPKEVNKYTYKYYKGLGSHTESGFKEVSNMFKNIDEKIIVYVLDKEAIENMFIYYGPDTSPRKKALAIPDKTVEKDGLIQPLSKQFRKDSAAYQRDNIIRKLPQVQDGLVDCRRKVLFTALTIGHKEVKVPGLAGEVVAKTDYHHGEESLTSTIIYMAQGLPQARQLPLLRPRGNFGSRTHGYKDNGAPRYLFVSCNWQLTEKIFRKEDTYILDYTVVEGERKEPNSYAPIIPMCLCETNDLPATGWKITVHARNLNDIFKNLRELITGKIEKCNRLRMNTEGLLGTFTNIPGKGKYFIPATCWDERERTLTIFSLPYNGWSYYFINGSEADKINKKEETKGVKNDPWVEDYKDNTTDEQVNIVLKLKEGGYEYISDNFGNEHLSCLEHYFGLYSKIHDHINLINNKYEVIEYATYEDVFMDWYEYRRACYEKRIERERIIAELEIRLIESMQRFNKLHDTYHITKNTTPEEAERIFVREKYVKYNAKKIRNPLYIPTELLEHYATSVEDGAGYDYLMDLSYNELTTKGYNKREERLKQLRDYIEYLKPTKEEKFIGARIWLDELDQLEKAIETGKATQWYYGEANYTFEEE
jgi:DNA topoisomerase-2